MSSSTRRSFDSPPPAAHAAPAASIVPVAEAPSENNRVAARRRMLKQGLIAYSGRHLTISCTVRDLSDTGARLIVADPMTVPNTFELLIEMDGFEADCVVAWRRNDTLGIRFIKPPRLMEPKRRQIVTAVGSPGKPSLRRKPIVV